MRAIDEQYLLTPFYGSRRMAEESLAAYFRFYCLERVHQSLGYRTSAEVYNKSAYILGRSGNQRQIARKKWNVNRY